MLHGILSAMQGQREELSAILVKASKLVSTLNGCPLYVNGVCVSDKHSIFISEILDSKVHHDNSLNVEDVREFMMKAISILDGQPTKRQEME